MSTKPTDRDIEMLHECLDGLSQSARMAVLSGLAISLHHGQSTPSAMRRRRNVRILLDGVLAAHKAS